MLMHALWPEDFPRLALHCLSHDVPEAWVGDVPAPTKRYAPGLREQLTVLEDRIQRDLGLPEDASLSEDDAEKVRSCDHLELYIWGREQILQGNLFVEEMVAELDNFFTERPFRFDAARLLYEEIRGGSRKLLPVQARVISDLCRG
jgi:5'-deoxynucleotidase YfbR-like HD superfamily hydrolase